MITVFRHYNCYVFNFNCLYLLLVGAMFMIDRGSEERGFMG
jgi:hypothetical protein